MPDFRVDAAHSRAAPPDETLETATDLLRAVAGRGGRRRVAQQKQKQASELAEALPGQPEIGQRELELQQQLEQLEEESRRIRHALRERQQDLQQQLGAAQHLGTEAGATARDPHEPLHGLRDQWRAALRRNYGDLAEQRSAEDPSATPRGPVERSVLHQSRLHLDAREAAMEALWQTRREQLQRRDEELSRRRGQLEQFQQQTAALYEESLAMRAVTEQLWAAATRGTPTPAVLQRIGEWQREWQQMQERTVAHLQRRREEICQAAQELERQHALLSETRQQLQEWLELRQQQLDERAHRLAVRERELLSPP